MEVSLSLSSTLCVYVGCICGCVGIYTGENVYVFGRVYVCVYVCMSSWLYVTHVCM